MFRLTYNWVLILIACALFAFFSILNPNFASAGYIVETIKMIAEIGIMTLPLTVLIVMGGIDLSMSSTLIVSAALGGIATPHVGNAMGLAIALLAGMTLGAFNATMISVLRLPPLVTTLATMYLFKGIAVGITLGTPSVGANVAATPIALFLGSSMVMGVPMQLLVFLLMALLFHLLLAKSPYGRIFYAIGFNEDSARFSGVNTGAVKFATDVAAGLVFAIAGQIFLGRFSTIQFDSADQYIMQVVTAAVLGGCDIRGGRGDIRGAVLGVSIIGILKGGMNAVLFQQTSQKIAIGVVLLLSLIALDLVNRRSERIAPALRGAA